MLPLFLLLLIELPYNETLETETVMAIMKITEYPDAPLREKASAVDRFDKNLLRLVDDMIETMFFSDGVGLAAPQVGISKQLLVLCEPDGDPLCLVNPEIVEMEGKEYGNEGCLSLPNLLASAPRATRIRVRAQDETGAPVEFEAHDFLARIIQHEYDHLQGKLFPDRLDVMTREALYAEWEEMKRNPSAFADLSK
ncbi:MAG: peptide deformylase [Candidatus Hydrogenedentes bacterium]|nr:peptide deformylase [Candidatus Hydrogenedentota bacterium]